METSTAISGEVTAMEVETTTAIEQLVTTVETAEIDPPPEVGEEMSAVMTIDTTSAGDSTSVDDTGSIPITTTAGSTSVIPGRLLQAELAI